MITLRSPLLRGLTTLLSFEYRTPRKVATVKQRIKSYNNRLDKFERQFHMRPPNLASKTSITFPITVPFLIRHRYIPKKLRERNTIVDDSSRIHWNRLTPNQILLGFQNIQYLEYNEMMEGLRYLSEVKGQQDHDWNSHPWVSRALALVNSQFVRIKKGNHLSVYYLMKKLKYSNEEFWKKMYAHIEENIYDIGSFEFEKFFLRYYKVSDQYFSTDMKQKFLTLMENKLRSFSPEGIIRVYEIYEEEEKLDDYWKFNVFVPLFKNQQYNYKPKDLHKIFRFMLVLGHEKDDRLYDALYKRLVKYETLTLEEIQMLQEVIQEVKDIFVSHRVDPYIAHLAEMHKKVKKELSQKKKEIPIHELVRQDLAFFLQKKKIKAEDSKVPPAETQSSEKQKATSAETTQ